VGTELVLPQSRSPEVPHSKKKKEILHGYRTSAPAVTHSRTQLMGIFMCIVCKYLLNVGLREQIINVTQLGPGILKFRATSEYPPTIA